MIAAFRMQDDAAAVDLHLNLLAQLRPDLLQAREAQFARALKAGAIGFLGKPFAGPTLIQCLGTALEGDRGGADT